MPFAFLEGPDLVIVLVIVVLLFGGAKLPGLARSLGQAQKEFHNATRGTDTTAAPQEATVTMTKAELDRLLHERSAEPPSPPLGTGDRSLD